jgi:hypothetical protein
MQTECMPLLYLRASGLSSVFSSPPESGGQAESAEAKPRVDPVNPVSPVLALSLAPLACHLSLLYVLLRNLA